MQSWDLHEAFAGSGVCGGCVGGGGGGAGGGRERSGDGGGGGGSGRRGVVGRARSAGTTNCNFPLTNSSLQTKASNPSFDKHSSRPH